MTPPHNPDRDLPDPGHEHTTTCAACGGECEPDQRTCDECHWGPQDDGPDVDEPSAAREPIP